MKEINAEKIFILGHSLGPCALQKFAETQKKQYCRYCYVGRPCPTLIGYQFLNRIDYVNKASGTVVLKKNLQANSLKWQVKNAMSADLSFKTKSAMLHLVLAQSTGCMIEITKLFKRQKI